MSGQESTTEPTRRRSFASSGLSYEQVAQQLGLLLCAGLADCHWSGQLTKPSEAAHQRGVQTGRVIHWTRRRMSRRGLYQFLRLASRALYPEEVIRRERWLALYRQDQYARMIALSTFRVRLPAEYGRREKARVRLDLAKRASTADQVTIRRVLAWTRT